MAERPYTEEAAEILLEQFEFILDHHKFIDEIGFVHPSQFAELNEISTISSSHAKNCQKLNETCGSDTASLNCLQNVQSVFWYGNYKLAVSVEVVPLLYNAALLAYMDARGNYKKLFRTKNKNSLSTATYETHNPEADILKHSRALLILCPDFGSIWNSRKLVLSRELELSLFIADLNLSMLILSYSPKSEQTWSHRRWLIKNIAEKFHDICDIIGKESELVKVIAEKSKMNYRAWSHRCWLIMFMTKEHMFDELNKSKNWAELHVADNSCFHYRRSLLIKLLEAPLPKDYNKKHSGYMWPFFNLLKEELNWNAYLIKMYMGREALWVHRRFVSYYWIKHVTNPVELEFPCKDQAEMIHSLDCFLGEEIKLVLACLSIPSDEFNDIAAQAQHAATYILWISKEIVFPQQCRFKEKLKEVGDFKTILINTCPERQQLWDRLLNPLPDEVEE